MAELLRLAERVVDLADGDPTMGDLIFGSPLAIAITFRGAARCCLGIPGWKDDFAQGLAMARAADPISLAGASFHTYPLAITNGALLPDATALRDTTDALASAKQSSDDIAVMLAQLSLGITLVHRDGPKRDRGCVLLAQVRDTAVKERFSLAAVPGC
jgi:adenylate cyclase